jgi:hypothetical protein
VIVDVNASTSTWSDAPAWRASFETDGSPGEDDYLRGDLNADQRVDLLDLAIFQVNLGITVGATRSQGDMNRDGAITRADAAALARNFGRSFTVPQAPSASAAIVAENREPVTAARLPRPTSKDELAASSRRRLVPAISDHVFAEPSQTEVSTLKARRSTMRAAARVR